MTTWRPGRRRAQRELETPYEGVPDHLMVPIWSWLNAYLDADEELIHAVGVEFRMVLPDPRTGWRAKSEAIDRLRKLAAENRHFMLDLVEYVLELKCHSDLYRSDYQGADALENVLALANSVFKVREDRGGLEMRTTPEVQTQVQHVVATAPGSAGDHLAAAWNAAYSRAPDPAKSYSESIKAVEAALAQHVSPQNGRQTLGTMIRDVSAKPSKWKFVIADGTVATVETMLHMMRTLWDGQTSRHGGIGTTRAETVGEAQAAVHLAATLVQFGVSGAFSPV